MTDGGGDQPIAAIIIENEWKTILYTAPSRPSTLVAEGIHQVHLEMAGSAEASGGNNLTEMNWVETT